MNLAPGTYEVTVTRHRVCIAASGWRPRHRGRHRTGRCPHGRVGDAAESGGRHGIATRGEDPRRTGVHRGRRNAEIARRPSVTVADHLKGVPGVDVNAGGIAQANIVTRGFNNAFSGALLTLQDYRFAAVPSLRVNVPFLFTGTNEDIERIEVLLGPASALYGPNSANGVLHIITKSPFTSQGTTLTLDGGERSILRGAARHAGLIGSKAGYKLSGEYFTGHGLEVLRPRRARRSTAQRAAARREPGGPARLRREALRGRGSPRPSAERQHGSHHDLRLHEGARWHRPHRRERHRSDQELDVPERPGTLSLESTVRAGLRELQRRRQQRQHVHGWHLPAPQRPADRGPVARVRGADPARVRHRHQEHVRVRHRLHLHESADRQHDQRPQRRHRQRHGARRLRAVHRPPVEQVRGRGRASRRPERQDRGHTDRRRARR